MIDVNCVYVERCIVALQLVGYCNAFSKGVNEVEQSLAVGVE